MKKPMQAMTFEESQKIAKIQRVVDKIATIFEQEKLTLQEVVVVLKQFSRQELEKTHEEH